MSICYDLSCFWLFFFLYVHFFPFHYAKYDVTEDPASLRSYYILLALYCWQILDASSCLRLIYFVYHVCIVFLSKHYRIRFGSVFLFLFTCFFFYFLLHSILASKFLLMNLFRLQHFVESRYKAKQNCKPK